MAPQRAIKNEHAINFLRFSESLSFCSRVKTLFHLPKNNGDNMMNLSLAIKEQDNTDAILSSDNQIQPNQPVSLINERLGVGM